MVWRHCRRRAIYWLLRSPHCNNHAKPKTQINRRRTLQLSRWWDACRKRLAWKTSLEKWDAVALQQIKERGALPMIDRGDIRQAIDRAAISGLHCRALVMVSSSIRLTGLIAKFKEAGGTVREIDVWAESPRLSHSGYLHIVCLSWAGNHYRDNAIAYKPSATKMPENWSWRTRQLLTCRCVRDVAALDAKYTKELADAKAENDHLRDDVAAGRRRLHIKAVCQSVREATPPPADNVSLPDWQTHRWGIISPSEGWSLCKNNWKEPRSILMSSADRVTHIDGQLVQSTSQA